MSSQTKHTVVVANRPRFIRELLSHVLPHMGEQIRVINVGNQNDLAASITHGNWLIVSEAHPDHIRVWQNSRRELGVIVLSHTGSALVFRPLTSGSQTPETINNLALPQLVAIIEEDGTSIQPTSKPDRRTPLSSPEQTSPGAALAGLTTNALGTQAAFA